MGRMELMGLMGFMSPIRPIRPIIQIYDNGLTQIFRYRTGLP